MRRGRMLLPSWVPITTGVCLTAVLCAALVASVLGWPAAPFTRGRPPDEELIQDATARMDRAAICIRESKRRAGVVVIGAAGDTSGLIGDEWTPLTTTLGSLDAKAVSTSPAWARAIALQLQSAGVHAGSVVTASFSGSFPALNLAVVSACQALGARLIAVSSVTASAWGANQPGFTWPEMEVRLVRAGLITPVSVAVSTGGADDRASDLEPEARRLALDIATMTAAALGASLMQPSNFEEMVDARLRLFATHSAPHSIAVFVNVGGHEASLGRSPAILLLRSGLIDAKSFDRSPDRGLVARMAERGIPVLHLLNVRDLALRWGVQ